MRTCLSIDDDLLQRARALTGVRGTTALVREALRALVARESARCLVRLGASEPALEVTPRARG